jgi:methionine-rich copper-binding protein CopC
MRIARWLSSFSLVAYAAVAVAHVHLEQSVPAEGAVVATGPTQIVLTFSEAARVTALWLKQDAKARQKLGPVPTEAAKTLTVPTPGLKPGSYVVTWTAVSPDSHVMSGQLHFKIS